MRRVEEQVTKVTYHIESLSDFQQGDRQATLDNVLSNRLYHELDGWVDIHIPSDIKDQILDQVCKIIGGRYKRTIREALLYRNPNHWAIPRFIYAPHREQFEYVAGQDQSWEMNHLRRHLYKL